MKGFLGTIPHFSLSDSQQYFQGFPSSRNSGDKLHITRRPRWHPSHSPATDLTAIGRQSDPSHSCLLLADNSQGQEVNSCCTGVSRKRTKIAASRPGMCSPFVCGQIPTAEKCSTASDHSPQVPPQLLTVARPVMQLRVFYGWIARITSVCRRRCGT